MTIITETEVNNMGFVIGLFIGATVGVGAISFIQGASMNNREQEAYMEGFLAGQLEKEREIQMEDYLASEIKAIKEGDE